MIVPLGGFFWSAAVRDRKGWAAVPRFVSKPFGATKIMLLAWEIKVGVGEPALAGVRFCAIAEVLDIKSCGVLKAKINVSPRDVLKSDIKLSSTIVLSIESCCCA